MYRLSIYLLTISLIGVVSFFIPLYIDLLEDEVIDDLNNLKAVGISLTGMCLALIGLERNDP